MENNNSDIVKNTCMYIYKPLFHVIFFWFCNCSTPNQTWSITSLIHYFYIYIPQNAYNTLAWCAWHINLNWQNIFLHLIKYGWAPDAINVENHCVQPPPHHDRVDCTVLVSKLWRACGTESPPSGCDCRQQHIYLINIRLFLAKKDSNRTRKNYGSACWRKTFS